MYSIYACNQLRYIYIYIYTEHYHDFDHQFFFSFLSSLLVEIENGFYPIHACIVLRMNCARQSCLINKFIEWKKIKEAKGINWLDFYRRFCRNIPPLFRTTSYGSVMIAYV